MRTGGVREKREGRSEDGWSEGEEGGVGVRTGGVREKREGRSEDRWSEGEEGG